MSKRQFTSLPIIEIVEESLLDYKPKFELAKRDLSLHKNEAVQLFCKSSLGKRRLFSEEKFLLKMVAHDLTAILSLICIYFVGRVSGKRYVQKSYEVLLYSRDI